MKFSYLAYQTSDSAGRSSTVHRPAVPINFRGPKDAIRRFGLVDTGSDFTLAPDWIADVIGVSLAESPTALVVGVEGSPIETRTAFVELELCKGKKSLRFAARIHFAAQDYVLLGTQGFLEFLTATFNWDAKTVELLPNSHLASA